MKDFPEILGNCDLRSRLAADIREDMLAHAYIIEGPLGCGKHTLAYEIAAAVSCENAHEAGMALPCRICPSCRKILARKSPDVTVISRGDGKVQLGVDKIRALREDVRFLPNDLERKVYIIEDADTMNVQAQNAFLLTLEEPPKYVLFLLLCESSASLLETVRSRAPRLRMSTLTDNEVRSYLTGNDSTASELEKNAPAEFEEIIKLASGSIGKAKTLLDPRKREPLIASRHLAKDFLTALPQRKRGAAVINLLLRFSQKRDELAGQLTEAELAVRDLILIKKSDTVSLSFFTSEEEAAELALKYRSLTLIKIAEALAAAKERLSRNSNIRLTLYALAVDCGLI